MTSAETFAIVLAAGMGTRMRSQTPKVMHQIAGRPAVDHVLAGLNDAGVTQSVVVIGPELESQSGRFAPHPTAVQRDRLGTGHAVKIALDETDISSNTVLIVYGDTPLLTSATIQRLVELQRSGAGICLLAFRPKNPAAYGRLIVEGDQVDRIVEAADASPEELDEFTEAVIPLKITGPLVSPSISVDLEKLLRERVEDEIKDRLKDKLKGLFD